MKKEFDSFYNGIIEKDEHKKSAEYKKLSPKMKKVIDSVFSTLESKPGDFLKNFEKVIDAEAKKHNVKSKDIMKYFDKGMLTI